MLRSRTILPVGGKSNFGDQKSAIFFCGFNIFLALGFSPIALGF